MIGSRIGSKTSIYGSAIGSVADDEGAGGIPGVTRDSTSLIYLPANATEWTTFLSAVGLSALNNPSSCWNFQEVSGNIIDQIGSLNLVQSGTAPTYGTTVAGYTRKFVSIALAATTQLQAAIATGPDPSTTSSLWCFVDAVATPGATRVFMSASDSASPCNVALQATQKYQQTTLAAIANGLVNNSAAVQPHCLKYSRGLSEVKYLNAQEKIVGTYSALVLDGNKGLAAPAGPPAHKAGYGFMYSGANADMSDANLKLLLVAMGFSIPWS